ncbi:hypothetical protein AU468_06130 [Alkalispirochaeta sphaeroplastigenens]|uniref:Band 7 domain-containing protein n=1 Tax=Alkalispirochaeta sphaeroplastigenens TaxID=1187066 RepID=A0A2S4JTI2_9SPIO|nr:hypothetical protein [Alkalispirochaeta sphaeroplastigenens]POR02829.1 hypothetical protein AU468_06130 [Alkalispirochaeta sphaeroplastigenens]
MKRFVALLIILLVLGAVAFGVGYVPLRLQDGTVAVLYTKTSGWDPEPLQAGTFDWRWELLIPTNARIHHFPDTPRRAQLHTSALLPSAELYETFLEGAPSLRQELTLEIQYRPVPQNFVTLAPRGISSDNIEPWLVSLDRELTGAALVFAATALEDLLEAEDLLVPVPALTREIADKLQARFPDLDIQAVVVESLELPDPQLYRLARDTYRRLQRLREEALGEAIRAAARDREAADHRVSMLQQFGKVFSEYPVLLEYLEITARTGQNPLKLDIPLQDASLPGQDR